MPKGGKREGAGRKPLLTSSPHKARLVHLSDEQWEHCKAQGKSKASDYIRRLIDADRERNPS